MSKGIRSTTGFYEQVELFKRDLISVALRESRGNVKQASRMLELHPGTLHVYLNRYGIDPSAQETHSAAHNRFCRCYHCRRLYPVGGHALPGA